RSWERRAPVGSEQGTLVHLRALPCRRATPPPRDDAPVPAGPAPTQTTCYRPPDRPGPISCTRCGRTTCVDDAIDAPVGYLCPGCVRQPAHVERAQRRVAGAQSARATTALLGIIVVVYVAQLGTQLPNGWSELVVRGGLFGPA